MKEIVIREIKEVLHLGGRANQDVRGAKERQRAEEIAVKEEEKKKKSKEIYKHE